MVNKELTDYIKRQFEHGHDSATIREHLLKHGYTEMIADEALHIVHPSEKPHIKGLKYLPFSAKKIAIAFLVVFALGGIGFALTNMLSNSEDLAGDATEQIDIPLPNQIEQEITQKEQAIVGEIEENSEDSLLLEETTEEIPAQEETTEELPVTGCTSDSSCDTGYVCYQKVCSIDNDRDMLSDEQEKIEGTDPHDQDSDDDGYFDFQEWYYDVNPLDAADPGYVTCASTTDCDTGSTCTEEGICVVCEDTDGLNYKKKGITQGVHYTTGKAILAQDNCKDESTLMEYYCRDASAFYFEEVSCEDEFGTGYSCNMGKCVS